MSTAATTDRISHLRELLGPAVLLPWPAQSKGDLRKWKHLRLADMDDPSHLTTLDRADNIGVALGQVSNGLVTIDLDQGSYMTAFLQANPLLNNTLRTRAARGCNIWVRCRGAYPSSQKLKSTSGRDVGEWRADGNQTIISGTHPEGMPYQIVVERPVIIVRYDAIIWPTYILPPRATESNRVRRVKENEVVGECVVTASSRLIERFSNGELISQVAPINYHQNNASLFKLARLVKGCETELGQLATAAELEFVFDRWCLVARRFWRHTRNDYWAEFLEAYHYARLGLDQDPIEVALSRARTLTLPEVTGFTDERVRLLAGICREMQRLVGDHSFFLPTRKLAQLLEAHWSSVARWLVNLEVLAVIRLAPGEVRKRGGIRCPRYHFGPPETKTLAPRCPNGSNKHSLPLHG